MIHYSGFYKVTTLSFLNCSLSRNFAVTVAIDTRPYFSLVSITIPIYRNRNHYSNLPTFFDFLPINRPLVNAVLRTGVACFAPKRDSTERNAQVLIAQWSLLASNL